MNRDRAKELLPVIQAFAEGKVVQYKQANTDWIDCREADFGMGFLRDTEYRIKPKPRERWLLAKPDHILPSTHESRHEALIFRKTLAEENGAHFNEYEPVLFREVLDD